MTDTGGNRIVAGNKKLAEYNRHGWKQNFQQTIKSYQNITDIGGNRIVAGNKTLPEHYSYW